MPYTNEDIIDALYRLYEQPMYFAAYGILHDEYLAEDAVHEAFVRLIRSREKIKDVRSPSVRSYVYKTLKSSALDIYRRQKKQHERCTALDEAVENTYTAEESDCDMPLELISQLPQKYASVMRCLFVDGLSIREASAVLKSSEACVRKRLERARKLLKNQLTSKEIYNGKQA